MAFEKGQHVNFHRAHDSVHELSGEVVEVKGNGEVLVKTEPSGVLVWTHQDHAELVANENLIQKIEHGIVKGAEEVGKGVEVAGETVVRVATSGLGATQD